MNLVLKILKKGLLVKGFNKINGAVRTIRTYPPLFLLPFTLSFPASPNKQGLLAKI